MSTSLDVEKLRRVGDRLAVLGCDHEDELHEAEEIVRGLTQAELGWLAAEFQRCADVCFEAAAELEGTMARAGRGEER